MLRVTRTTTAFVDDYDEDIDYTQTLRNICEFLDETTVALEETWSTLETHSTTIASDATLSDEDRDRLTSALENLISSLGRVHDETTDAWAYADDALDAFKHLPMDE